MRHPSSTHNRFFTENPLLLLCLPVVLIIGVGFFLWVGMLIFQQERTRWENSLRQHADAYVHELDLKWERTTAYLQGMGNLLEGQKPQSNNSFAFLGKKLLADVPQASGVIYMAPSGQAYQYTESGSGFNNAMLTQLGRRDYQCPRGKACFIAQPSTMNRQKMLVVLQPLSPQAGQLFMALNVPELLAAPANFVAGAALEGLNLSDSLDIRLSRNGETLFAQSPSQNTEEPAFRHAHVERWGGAEWAFVFNFNRQAAGGPNYWLGLGAMGAGGLLLLAFGGLMMAQTRQGKRVRELVSQRTNELEQSSRRFRLMTDNAYDLIAITNTDMDIDYVNTAYSRVLGYQREDLLNTNLRETVHPKDLVVFTDHIRRVLQGEQTDQLPVRMKHKNGVWRHVDIVAKALHAPDWRVHEVVIHGRDVTTRKQFEDDLASSEQRFRDFADASADWLWEIDDKGTFQFVSRGVQGVLGFDQHDLEKQKTLLDVLEPHDGQETREHSSALQEAVEAQNPFRDIECWTRTADDQRVCLSVSAIPILNEKGLFQGYRGVASNITSVKLQRDHLQRMATTDHLTGLLNRRRFMEELERSVTLAQRHEKQGVLMFIDLDRFKEINDTHGHEAGDKILKGVTRILKQSFRTTDILARLGGDEFAVIIHTIDVPMALEKVQKVVDKIAAFSIDYHGAKLSVTMSVGMVVYPQEDKDSDALVMAADMAMYRAKDMGRNRIYVDEEDSTNETKTTVREQLRWVDRLRTCLETKDFELWYQPIVATKETKMPKFEALLRIYDEAGNVGSPAVYIDAAEHFGLIQQLDLAVVEKAFQDMADADAQKHTAELSINLSSRTLGESHVVNAIGELVKTYSIDPSRVTFEVTETMALHDPRAWRNISEIRAFIQDLQKLGFKFALDDFGKGFSSFSYIRMLPVDAVKIDGDFVKDMATDEMDFAFVQNIARLCQDLGISTIAEFVENAEILAMLKDIGIDAAQGYHLGKPEKNLAKQAKQFQGKGVQSFL